jgi:hypothetical protein
MKKLLIIVLMCVANTLSVYSASPADTCAQLNVSAQADDLLTVTMVSISIVEKTGSNQLTISYKQANNTSDKKLDEGSFALFFADGTAMPQYGFFNYFFPGDSRQRAHTWEYLKSQNPIAITYNPGFFAQTPNPVKLNWAIPGKACQISVLTDNTAAKAAADKAAADKAAADAVTNAASRILVDAASAAIDAANAAVDAANLAADSIDSESQEFLDSLDIAIQKAKTTGIKTELNLKKVLINNQARLTQVQSKQINAQNLSEKCLMLSKNKTLPTEAQRMYLTSYDSWVRTLKTLTYSQNQLSQRVQRISDSQTLVNKAAEEFLAAQSVVNKANPILKKTTITCIKGKLTKKVTAVKPMCPAGYKKK